MKKGKWRGCCNKSNHSLVFIWLMRYAVLVFLIAISCNKQIELKSPEPAFPGYVAFTIPKGSHYASQSAVRTFKGQNLSYIIKFDSSAIYQTIDPKNQEDVNKLFGFSDNNDHHETSARFGWNWDGRSIQLYAYCYDSGVRSITPVGSVDINREYYCSIKLLPATYEFSLSDTRHYIPRASFNTQATGYHLYPYFGGDETAPHDITIFLRAD